MAQDFLDYLNQPKAPTPGDPLDPYANRVERMFNDDWGKRAMGQAEMVSGMTGGMAGYLRPLAAGIPKFMDIADDTIRGVQSSEMQRLIARIANAFDILPEYARRTVSKFHNPPGGLNPTGTVDGIKQANYRNSGPDSGMVQLDLPTILQHSKSPGLLERLGLRKGGPYAGPFDSPEFILRHETGHAIDRAVKQLWDNRSISPRFGGDYAQTNPTNGNLPLNAWAPSVNGPMATSTFTDLHNLLGQGGAMRTHGQNVVENMADALGFYLASPRNRPVGMYTPQHDQAARRLMELLEQGSQNYPGGLP